MQLRTICDSVLYAYLSKVADTAEKQHYLRALCTAVEVSNLRFSEVDPFLHILDKFKIFDLHHSIFQPDDLHALFATITYWSPLLDYFREFRSDPERSREFYYEDGLWHAFVATRYMRFLRTLSDSR